MRPATSKVKYALVKLSLLELCTHVSCKKQQITYRGQKNLGECMSGVFAERGAILLATQRNFRIHGDTEETQFIFHSSCNCAYLPRI